MRRPHCSREPALCVAVKPAQLSEKDEERVEGKTALSDIDKFEQRLK